MTRDQLKTHARRLRTDLARQHITISNSQALELTARMHGYEGWNNVTDTSAPVYSLFMWKDDPAGPSLLSHHTDQRSAQAAAQRYADTFRTEYNRDYPEDALTGPYAPGAPLYWYEPAVKDLHTTQRAAQVHEDEGGVQLIIIHAPLAD